MVECLTQGHNTLTVIRLEQSNPQPSVYEPSTGPLNTLAHNDTKCIMIVISFKNELLGYVVYTNYLKYKTKSVIIFDNS